VSESEEPPNPDPSPPQSPSLPALRGAPSRLHLALAFATIYVIWGSTYLAIRIGVQSIPPFLMAGSRYLLAGGILFVLLRGSGVGAPAC
jgi:drug/metabolite transporter (DMT)-like permease